MTESVAQKPAGWENILASDEEILWQGTPAPGIRIKGKNVFTLFFGLFFSGFALFWMVMASQAGGYFWAFGLIHFTAGLGVAFLPVIWPAVMAKRTWYTLTNKRAYIATTSVVGTKKLQSYPINQDTQLSYTGGHFQTVTFASERRRGSKGRSYTHKIGFRDLTDGDAVMRLMRDIQNDEI